MILFLKYLILIIVNNLKEIVKLLKRIKNSSKILFLFLKFMRKLKLNILLINLNFLFFFLNVNFKF